MSFIRRIAGRAVIYLVMRASYGSWSAAKAHDAIYAGQDSCGAFREILREAFGDEFPEGVDGFSFVTATDLRDMAAALRVGPGRLFADLACGRGGPGMWLARATGACVHGVDISPGAVGLARKRIREFGLAGRVTFTIGDFHHTGLEGERFDAAVSVDALWCAPDKPTALAEIARILKRGAPFVFTTWDGNIPLMPPDHRGLLADAGFMIEEYRETPGWRERQLAVYAMVLERADRLVSAMGKEAARPLIREAKSVPAVLAKSRRVFVVAVKK